MANASQLSSVAVGQASSATDAGPAGPAEHAPLVAVSAGIMALSETSDDCNPLPMLEVAEACGQRISAP